MNFPHYACIEEVVQPGDGLILDAFGVFWAGGKEGFYPGSLDVFQRLLEKQIPIVILSNSTQLSQKAQAKYKSVGLQEAFYGSLLTSGEIARRVFLDEQALKQVGLTSERKTYWVYQPVHPVYGLAHLDIFKDTGYQNVATLDEADFIYVGIPHVEGVDQLDSRVFEQEIAQLVKSQKPMLVANPDRYVQEGNGSTVVRQGEIGRLYESYGGKVIYLGKPSKIAFDAAIDVLKSQGISKERLWMVGDNVETDICGANASGLRSLLIVETGMTHQAFLKARETSPELTLETFLHELPSKYHPSATVSRFSTSKQETEKANRSLTL